MILLTSVMSMSVKKKIIWFREGSYWRPTFEGICILWDRKFQELLQSLKKNFQKLIQSAQNTTSKVNKYRAGPSTIGKNGCCSCEWPCHKILIWQSSSWTLVLQFLAYANENQSYLKVVTEFFREGKSGECNAMSAVSLQNNSGD